MKKLFPYLFVLVALGFVFTSCDKIDHPYEDIVIVKVDSALYPGGDWQDYLDHYYPTFTENPNTSVNVLIEDYTGHLCSNCPPAAVEAHSIHESNPNRVFVASIHMNPGATKTFQNFDPGGEEYFTDFTNSDGEAYGKEFEDGFNFTGNPSGNVNRKRIGVKMFDSWGTWQSRTDAILSANDLKANIQSVFNYFASTGGGFLHAEFEKKTNDPIEMNAVVYVIEDSLVTWQLMPDNTDNEFYVHRDIHLGNIANNPWGLKVFDAAAELGDKVILDYSYKLPVAIDKDNLHFLIYIYDVNTYEILQVIRQDIVDTP